jgi:hypothetical protein
MFGAVNSLFSGLAMAGVIYAIFQQHRAFVQQNDSISLQREELELTRAEIGLQNDNLLAQHSAIEAQQKSNMFFQLMAFFIDITNSLNLPMGERPFVDPEKSGNRCFHQFWIELRDKQNELRRDQQQNYSFDHFKERYTRFYSRKSSQLAHYYQTLLVLCEFILNCGDNKMHFARICNAQLTKEQRSLWWYHTISTDDNDVLNMLFFRLGFHQLLAETDFFSEEDFTAFINQKRAYGVE